MCVLELVSAKLAAHAACLQRGSRAAGALSPSDLAAMMSGLGRGPVALAYAKLAGDDEAARTVYAILHVLASDWARLEGWTVPRGSEQVGRLARMVRDDLILPRPMLSERASAEKLGISRRQWVQVWRDRHYRLLAVGLEWECELRRKLSREVYGGRDQ